MEKEKNSIEMEMKKKLIEEIVPVFEKLPPEKKERVLGYALGLADSKEMAS